MRTQIVEDVTFLPIKPTPKGLIGFASCTYNQSIVLNSIAVYTRPDGSGIRCVYPDKILANGKKIGLYYPISKMLQDQITGAVLGKIQSIAGASFHE